VRLKIAFARGARNLRCSGRRVGVNDSAGAGIPFHRARSDRRSHRNWMVPGAASDLLAPDKFCARGPIALKEYKGEGRGRD
jgi:hypothetical protein